MQRTPIVIIGAGMSGMLAALFIKSRDKNANILIVESANTPGGHYREVKLDGFGACDFAMRFIYETGLPALDAVIRNILPEHEWHIYPDNEKDIAGVYWQGALQTNSPYLDLRRLSKPLHQQCEQEILQATATPAANAADALRNRFGPITAGYLTQVLEKFYHILAPQLDASATLQPAMNRVILYDENVMRDKLTDDALRQRLAWPDQLTFPLKRIPSQSALYPKRFGMNRVIEAMQRQLTEQGVTLAFNTRITACETIANRITNLTLDNGTTITAPERVIASGGLQSAYKLLHPTHNAAPPPRSWMVYLRLSHAPRMGRLYHFYNFEESHSTFRVTNYANYCPAAATAEGYPICVELWSTDKSPMAAIERATRELGEMKLLPSGCRIVAQAAQSTQNLHALCTTVYMRDIRCMRAELVQKNIANLLTIGPFAEEGVMLLYEVWRDMYHKILQPSQGQP